MVLPDSDRISRVPSYSGTPRELKQFSVTGLSPSLAGLPSAVLLTTQFLTLTCGALQPHIRRSASGLGSSRFARHYSGNLILDLSSSRYLDGSVPWVSLPMAI